MGFSASAAANASRIRREDNAVSAHSRARDTRGGGEWAPERGEHDEDGQGVNARDSDLGTGGESDLGPPTGRTGLVDLPHTALDAAPTPASDEHFLDPEYDVVMLSHVCKDGTFRTTSRCICGRLITVCECGEDFGGLGKAAIHDQRTAEEVWEQEKNELLLCPACRSCTKMKKVSGGQPDYCCRRTFKRQFYNKNQDYKLCPLHRERPDRAGSVRASQPYPIFRRHDAADLSQPMSTGASSSQHREVQQQEPVNLVPVRAHSKPRLSDQLGTASENWRNRDTAPMPAQALHPFRMTSPDRIHYATSETSSQATVVQDADQWEMSTQSTVGTSEGSDMEGEEPEGFWARDMQIDAPGNLSHVCKDGTYRTTTRCHVCASYLTICECGEDFVGLGKAAIQGQRTSDEIKAQEENELLLCPACRSCTKMKKVPGGQPDYWCRRTFKREFYGGGRDYKFCPLHRGSPKARRDGSSRTLTMPEGLDIDMDEASPAAAVAQPQQHDSLRMFGAMSLGTQGAAPPTEAPARDAGGAPTTDPDVLGGISTLQTLKPPSTSATPPRMDEDVQEIQGERGRDSDTVLDLEWEQRNPGMPSAADLGKLVAEAVASITGTLGELKEKDMASNDLLAIAEQVKAADTPHIASTRDRIVQHLLSLLPEGDRPGKDRPAKRNERKEQLASLSGGLMSLRDQYLKPGRGTPEDYLALLAPIRQHALRTSRAPARQFDLPTLAKCLELGGAAVHQGMEAFTAYVGGAKAAYAVARPPGTAGQSQARWNDSRNAYLRHVRRYAVLGAILRLCVDLEALLAGPQGFDFMIAWRQQAAPVMDLCISLLPRVDTALNVRRQEEVSKPVMQGQSQEWSEGVENECWEESDFD